MAVTVRIEVEHDDGEMTIVRQSVINDIRPGARQRITAQLIGDAVGQIITASAAGVPVRLGELVGIVSQAVYRVIPATEGWTPNYGPAPIPMPVLRDKGKVTRSASTTNDETMNGREYYAVFSEIEDNTELYDRIRANNWIMKNLEIR